MKQIFCLIFTFFCLNSGFCSNRWPNHDISTLKLLQIVHRHGERTPLMFVPNDPYKNQTFWPEGSGELTTKGKYRLYKLGQFIRQEYDQYFGQNYNPREVYARSSITDRCIESVSCLLSGAYPPKQKEWQWNKGTDAELGNIWQPFPIQTFMPKSDDLVCNEEKFCLAVYNEMAKIYKRPVIQQYLDENRVLFENLTKITGSRVVDIVSAGALWDTLSIEAEHNYFWTDVWTREEQLNVIKKLSVAHELEFRYNWDSPIIKRLRAGGLVKELIKNIQSVVNNGNQNKKLYVYSTHDTTLTALMHALNIYNGNSPPFGATLLFELHEKQNGSHNKTNEYFVRAYYHNETQINTGVPHSVQWTDCQNMIDCPINQYLNSTEHLLYDNFNDECNRK